MSVSELTNFGGVCELRSLLARGRGGDAPVGVEARRQAGDHAHAWHHQAEPVGYRVPTDRRCFVPSAVYGPDAPETEALRAFRDWCLRRTLFGRTLIRSRYRVGLMLVWLASALSSHVRRLAQRLLAPLVSGCARWR